MSRSEAWDALRGELTRLPHWRLGEVLPEDFAVERRLTNRRWFEFQDAGLGPGDHVYEGRILSPEGRPSLLRRGEAYMCFANPLDPGHLLVCDGRLRVLGVAPRVERPCRDDAEAGQRAMKRTERDFAEVAAPFAERGIRQAREEAERIRHNLEIFGSAEPPAPTPSERQLAQKADLAIASASRREVASAETPTMETPTNESHTPTGDEY